MAPKKSQRGKRQRAQTRPPIDRSRRIWRRARRLALLVILGGAIALYIYDRGGPSETIRAEVVRVRPYTHQSTSGGGPHTHTEAVIEFEGRRHTLPRADGLTVGQEVLVDVRRGRLSGRPRFASLRSTDASATTQPFLSQPRPWQYDVVQNRHWNPLHGHWHDGPPPPADER
jgi:hypothetical protein